MSRRRIAYLGPSGTFTEEAALHHAPQEELLPFPSISAVAAAVDSGMAEEGIVPIENSLQGSVTETLDLLIHESPVSICQELVLPIQHYLMAKAETVPADVRVIYSHPQALAQCRQFLEKCFPKAELMASLSTAAAVEQVLNSEAVAAAIATQRAAEVYGVEILARGIQDNPNNVTRFIVLAATDHPPTGRDKTSICFAFSEDRPGLLHTVLGEFTQREINLSKVESRPTKQILGEYFFLIDLEGHREDLQVQEALSRVRQMTSMLKVFGSYPRFTGPASTNPP